MAGILASMVVGGAEGGFKAAGENVDTRIKDKREAEKAAALEARQISLMNLRQKYGTSERLASQKFSQGQSDIAYQRKMDETGSGKYLNGEELSNRKLSMSSDMDKRGILSTQAYKEGERARKFEAEKGLLQAEADIKGKMPTDLEKKYNFLKTIMPETNAKALILAIGKTDKTDLGRQKLYNKVYTDTIKALSGDGMNEITPEMKAEAKKQAEWLSGYRGAATSEGDTQKKSMLDEIADLDNLDSGINKNDFRSHPFGDSESGPSLETQAANPSERASFAAGPPKKINQSDTTTVVQEMMKKGVQGVTESGKWKGMPIGTKRGKMMIYKNGKWQYMRRNELKEYKASVKE